MASRPRPTELRLRQSSRVLEITFDDGARFALPCEFLRVLSPSAEVQGHGPGQGTLPVGKERVNIDRIEPTGNYAVTLHFNDGHDSGIYAWDYLHDLGTHQQRYWADYLQRLAQAGHVRGEPSEPSEPGGVGKWTPPQ